MFVAEIGQLEFIGNTSKLPYDYVEGAKEWLSQWTCKGNFKLTIAKNHKQAVENLRQQLVAEFNKIESNRMLGYKAEDFVFTVIHSETEGDDNLFWNPNGSFCIKYPIITDKQKTE
jgi:hypothetical protein